MLDLDLGDASGRDGRLNETDGKFPNLERSDRHAVTRARAAAPVVRLVVPLTMVAPFTPIAAFALIVIGVPAFVMRGRRRGPLLVAELRNLAAEPVDKRMHLVRGNHRMRWRWCVTAKLGMGLMGEMRERRPVQERVVVGMMPLGHEDLPFFFG